MCGIVGQAGGDFSALGKMNRLQAHRGPNDSGEFVDSHAGVALAMRRLSILDLSGGRQPMSSRDGNLTIVFNGEIFNAPDLRAQLEKDGAVFQTHNSDTEVLLQLYARRGENMLAGANGMFAFVIFDRAKSLLFGARDRFGIKPFYYTQANGTFAFSSELKSLLAVPGVRRDICSQSVFHYLTLGFVPGEDTIIEGVRRLPAGHCFRYDVAKKKFQSQRYWEVPFSDDGPSTVEEAKHYVRAELTAAVQRWSLSDVPVACSLSGGLDSSTLVALLAKQSSHPLRTYSLGFSDEGADSLNELPLARQVAKKYGTDHHELILKADDMLTDLVAMTWHLDEPYGGGLPSWTVFKFMAKDVKVGFTGTGGDELFGDYGKFDGGWWPQRFEKRYADRFYYMTDRTKRDRALAMPEDRLLSTGAMLEAIYKSAPSAEHRNKTAYVDFKTQLPEEFLFMTDRFSMAHSLEARVPFLDHMFVQKVLGIPSTLRTKPRDLKYLLREAVADLLPPDLLRAEKRGFVLPTAMWLRGALKPLMQRLLQKDRLDKQGIFSSDYYGRLMEEHGAMKADHHKPLWFALMFQLWHRVFIEEHDLSRPTWSWSEAAR